MIRTFFYFLVGMAPVVACAEIGRPIDTTGMRREILAVYGREPQASFAVAFEDLSTGEQFFCMSIAVIMRPVR